MDEWKEWRRKEKLREQAFKKKCPKGSHWDVDLHQCIKDKVPAPKILETEAAKSLLKKAKATKTIGEQIPAQPVVPVGPVTIEQKVAALSDEVAEIKKLLANLYGLTGHSIEEVQTALTWKLRKP